jgi:hypothetical protein
MIHVTATQVAMVKLTRDSGKLEFLIFCNNVSEGQEAQIWSVTGSGPVVHVLLNENLATGTSRPSFGDHLPVPVRVFGLPVSRYSRDLSPVNRAGLSQFSLRPGPRPPCSGARALTRSLLSHGKRPKPSGNWSAEIMDFFSIIFSIIFTKCLQ